jgi:hypothetical protein
MLTVTWVGSFNLYIDTVIKKGISVSTMVSPIFLSGSREILTWTIEADTA